MGGSPGSMSRRAGQGLVPKRVRGADSGHRDEPGEGHDGANQLQENGSGVHELCPPLWYPGGGRNARRRVSQTRPTDGRAHRLIPGS